MKKLLKFLINKANPKENILQFMIRHLLLSDSGGNPSWTITILAWVMVLVTWVSITEIKLSHVISTVNNNGVITTSPRGFSSEFMYLLLLLAGLIVFFFKLRGPSQPGTPTETSTDKPEEPKEDPTQPSAIGTFIDTVKNIIGSLKK